MVYNQGYKFGLWELLYETKVSGIKCFRCKCKCGKIKDIRISNLIRGKSKSCGCSRIRDVALSDKSLEIINGLMLSDGYIDPNHKNAYLKFEFQYLEMCQHVISNLNQIKFSKPKERKKDNSKTYTFRSECLLDITKLHNIWYTKSNKPNRRYQKIIPKNLNITSEICYWWYIGDGYLDKSEITLATHDLDICGTKKLSSQLLELGFNNRVCKRNIVHIKADSIENFINYIGPSKIECYKYKWDLSFRKQVNHKKEQKDKLIQMYKREDSRKKIAEELQINEDQVYYKLRYLKRTGQL